MSDADFKLSPWPLIKLSWRTARDNICYVLQIGWVGFVLVGVLALVGLKVDISKYLCAGLVLHLLSALARAPFAVAWHRFILLGEEVTEGAYFKFDYKAASYGIYGFAIENMISLAGLVVLPVAAIVPLSTEGSVGISGVAMLIAIYFSLRLSMVFPAIAVGQEGAGLKPSFDLTRGHSFQLVIAALIALLVLMAVMMLLSAGLMGASHLIFGSATVGGGLMTLFIIPLSIILTAAYLAFYSHCFILLHKHR